jgi:hypothetical protein
LRAWAKHPRHPHHISFLRGRLAYQSTALRWFCCYECAFQFRQQVCVTMRPFLLTCPGCEQVGFVIGQARK